jgi:glycosyltransferase involved in cell wall biosynthesis
VKRRIKQALDKLAVFYGGWRLVVVLVGVLILVAASLFDRLPGYLAVGAIWMLTLLLIGVQKPPKMTVVTVEVEKPPAPVPTRDRGPLVTVVVTTFNEGAYLSHCLSSVKAQSHTRLECIVVDDASTDGSVEEAMLVVEADPRFRVLRNPANVGLAASRNVGLETAKGRFITFVDGDDFLYPKAVGERVAAFESAVDNGTLGGAFCNWQMVPEEEVPGADPPSRALRRNVTWLSAVEDNPFIASAPLILTESARTVGGFNENRTTAEDFDFWARYLRHGYAIRATKYVGIAYRQKKASMYRSTILDHVDIQLDVYSYNFRGMNTEDIRAGTPFVFAGPPSEYQQQLMRTRRLLVGFIVATHDRNKPAADDLLGQFERSLKPWMMWAEGWEVLIQKTVTRLESYDSEAMEIRVADLTRQVQMSVIPLLLSKRPSSSAAFDALQAKSTSPLEVGTQTDSP